MTIDKETGIWSLDTAIKHHKFDSSLAEFISKNYHSNLTADVGCGDGSYCDYLKIAGWKNLHGYEGTDDIHEIGVHDDIMIVDLTKVRWVDIPYEMVLCIEVGEHIPQKYEQVFLDNLCRYVCDTLILSWAYEGQKGSGHVNERPTSYIINEITRRGFIWNEAGSYRLREAASLSYLKHTLMEFRYHGK